MIHPNSPLVKFLWEIREPMKKKKRGKSPPARTLRCALPSLRAQSPPATPALLFIKESRKWIVAHAVIAAGIVVTAATIAIISTAYPVKFA